MARHIVITDTETGKTELDIVARAGVFSFTSGGDTEREVHTSTHWTDGNPDDIASVIHAMETHIEDFRRKYPQLALYLDHLTFKTEVISEEETRRNIEH